jgi:hypothetical protein
MGRQALADPPAAEIMQKNLLATKVLDSTTRSSFRLINAAGQQRIRETDGQTKLIAGTTDNRRLVNFLSPSDVRGTKTLLIEHSAADDEEGPQARGQQQEGLIRRYGFLLRRCDRPQGRGLEPQAVAAGEGRWQGLLCHGIDPEAA